MYLEICPFLSILNNKKGSLMFQKESKNTKLLCVQALLTILTGELGSLVKYSFYVYREAGKYLL
jgi:hypothetical protein